MPLVIVNGTKFTVIAKTDSTKSTGIELELFKEYTETILTGKTHFRANLSLKSDLALTQTVDLVRFPANPNDSVLKTKVVYEKKDRSIANIYIYNVTEG